MDDFRSRWEKVCEPDESDGPFVCEIRARLSLSPVHVSVKTLYLLGERNDCGTYRTNGFLQRVKSFRVRRGWSERELMRSDLRVSGGVAGERACDLSVVKGHAATLCGLGDSVKPLSLEGIIAQLIYLCGRIDDAQERETFRDFCGFWMNHTQGTYSSSSGVSVTLKQERKHGR